MNKFIPRHWWIYGACWVHPPTPPPPTGPNSFIFAYIFAEKHPHRGSTPPPPPRPLREILDPPLLDNLDYVQMAIFYAHLTWAVCKFGSNEHLTAVLCQFVNIVPTRDVVTDSNKVKMNCLNGFAWHCDQWKFYTNIISLRHSVNGEFCGHSRFVLWHQNFTYNMNTKAFSLVGEGQT